MGNSSISLASTPLMGWNSWNFLGCEVSEKTIREIADAIVLSGLKDCGYEYVVIDDCWSQKESRDSNGNLVPDLKKFPEGIKALADYIHNKGLKIGIYSDAADRTCAGYPGSYGFEDQDAQLWASWGIDFLKYDYCNAPEEQEEAIRRYTKMGQALSKTGREFCYSLCEWGARHPYLWGHDVGGHMWRVSGDVFDSWIDKWISGPDYYGIGVDTSIDIIAGISEYGGPGGWNDLDMLVVGLKGKGHVAGKGMSFFEYQTHMSIWCIACSPLMIGCDVRSLDKETALLLTNREVLAVNQDKTGIPGWRIKQEGFLEIWKKPLYDGSVAVALVNRGSSGNNITLKASDIGMLDTPKAVRNLWSREDTAEFKEKLSLHVQPHQTILLKVSV